MKIKTAIITTIFLTLVSTSPSIAFTDGFNASIEEEGITKLVNPGQSYTLVINLENTNPSQTVYPISFSLADLDTYSMEDTWITFDSSTLDLHNTGTTKLYFTLTIPSDTTAGEYIKAVGVSDIPFVDGTGSNPPTAIATPITVQVTENTIVPTPTPTSTPTTTSNSSTSETSNTGNTSPASVPSPANQITTNKTTWTAPKTSQRFIKDLFALVEAISLQASYSPLRQVSTFLLPISNEGNISTVPFGSLNLTTLTDLPIASLSLNQGKVVLRPGEETTIETDFVSEKYLLGVFKATSVIGYSSTLGSTALQSGPDTYFLHLGQRPLMTVILTLCALLLTFLLPHFRQHFKKSYLVFPTILLSLGLLGRDFWLSGNVPTNPLGTEISISVTGNVKQIIGAKSITLPGLEKAVYLSSTNPLGSSVWSLQNNSRSEIVAISQYTEPLYEVILNSTEETYPTLILPTGF